MGKTSHKAKPPPGDFKVTTPKNPLINNQTITSIRNLTNYPCLFRNTNLQLKYPPNTHKHKKYSQTQQTIDKIR